MSEVVDPMAAGGGGEDESRRAAAAFDAPAGGAAQEEMAATLRTVVETVRRFMRADTASIASFSLADRTITWRALSGFESYGAGAVDIVNPLRGEFAEHAAGSPEAIIEVRGLAGDLPVTEFPLHSSEGVRDLALAPLRVRGETLGVLAVGFRKSHRLNAAEKQQLEGLSEMAALALDNARLFETLGTAKRVWEQTFDAIPDGIIVHDDSMCVVRCNVAAAEAMEMRPSEIVGMSCADAFARLFGERAAAYHLRQPGPRATNSFELQAEDGRRYLVSVAQLSSLDSGERTLDNAGQTPWSVITWSDITELSEIQEQLARSRRLATVGQLAAGVAHEINNPLAAITTCAEATLRSLRATPEAAMLAEERNLNFYQEEIVRQALRCKSITRGLLDLSRQRRASREPVDLNALIERSAQLFAQRGAERRVEFRTTLDPDVGEVATDEAMVRQVLDNLLSNALDAVGEDGTVNVTTAVDSGRVVVEVADTGQGIPPDTLARIFDPFFTTKEPGRGSGLGLAISLTLAEAVGGSITVESKAGSGSRFRLWLPRRAPEE